MAKRRYTDEARSNALAALAANGGNVARTAAELGIPEATLRAWANGDRHPEALQMCEQKKGPLAEQCDAVAWALAGLMESAARRAAADGRVDKIATAFGILVDKAQLLRGEPTSRTETTGVPDSRVSERIASLLDSLRERRAGASGNGHPPAVAAEPRPPDPGV
jgi:hypothetical protein